MPEKLVAKLIHVPVRWSYVRMRVRARQMVYADTVRPVKNSYRVYSFYAII